MAYGFSYGGVVFNSDTLAPVGGALVGLGQEFLLRQLVDVSMANSFLKAGSGATPPFLLKYLGSFGSPSAFIGIISGAVGLVAGYFLLKKGSRMFGSFLLAYGSVALVFGILDGVFPAQAWANAVAVDPGNPVRIAGKSNAAAIKFQPRTTASAPVVNASRIGTI